jgi:uncharacterized protein (DUF1684 family)
MTVRDWKQATASGVLAPVLAAVVAVGGCTSGPPPPVDQRPYAQQIADGRAEKDRYFHADSHSPVPPDQRASFPNLSYFPVDPSYRIPASLTEDHATPPEIIHLTTSWGTLRAEQKVGHLTFSFGGSTYTLSAYTNEDEGMKRLFVPFRDLSSGIETYGGGRYLDLDRTSTGVYDLDFNRAYHPYCAYGLNTECPLPPAENRLTFAVRAGERMP